MCLIGQGQLVECTGCLVYSAQVNQNQQHQIVCIVHTSELILSTGKVGPTRSLSSSTSPQLTLDALLLQHKRQPEGTRTADHKHPMSHGLQNLPMSTSSLEPNLQGLLSRCRTKDIR